MYTTQSYFFSSLQCVFFLCNLLYFQLTGGHVHDSTVTVDILSHLDISNSTILADKAYGTNEILNYIQQQDTGYAIPPFTVLKDKFKSCTIVFCERK